jgi:hypothetical protein
VALLATLLHPTRVGMDLQQGEASVRQIVSESSSPQAKGAG